MSSPRRPHLPLALFLVALIAGCDAPLSPQARCFADATAAYRAAWREAARIRGDLERGYALHRVEIDVPQAVPCRLDGARASCLGEAPQILGLPVAIDRATHRARLVELDAELDVLRPGAMAAAAPCGYGSWANPAAAAPSP